MTNRLRVTGLRAAYGGRRVVDVDELVAAGGELLVIVGGAGSGKSTLAAALAGAVPARGRVEIDGRVVSGTPSRRRRLGLAVALRDAGPIRGCTVAEALRLAGGRTGRGVQILERVPQLATRGRVPAQLLSGGEQQLLRVAAAWCAAGQVLVLDSPTVGLAPDAQAMVASLAQDEVARGAAVLWLEQDARAAPPGVTRELSEGRILPLSAPAAEPATG